MRLKDRIISIFYICYNNLARYYYAPQIKRKYNVSNSLDSIKYIIKTRCSVSRYGDGEFDLIFGHKSNFQVYDSVLARRLKEVLSSKDQGHIVCIPYIITDFEKFIPAATNFWAYWVRVNNKRLFSVLDPNKPYYDASMSRFYMDYKDKSNCAYHINEFRKIWSGRDVIIIEGCKSRSGVGNDLFSNVHSIKRILAPAENAFARYDAIIDSIITNATKDKLILLVLGMTATVMAYDLHKLGYQAIDLGHIDMEYEWFRMGATKKVIIKGKYVNEVQGGNHVEEIDDQMYLSQIVQDISK